MIVAFLCLLALQAGTAWAKSDPVLKALSAMQKQGSTEAPSWRSLYEQGKTAARHLRGASRANVQGVLGNLTSLARRGMLPARAYPAFLVLQRNLEWFWDERRPPVPFGTRTTFPGSQIIYEFYPGSGWQLQPLANFGHLNGLLKLRHPKKGQLESFADELLQTAVTRNGFLAFEYYFPWSGGPPGWVSGMATATGMQAFSGLWRRDGDSRYRDAARAMEPVFDYRPPIGVRRPMHYGPFFLQYSQAPWLLVGNAYAQSILGLDAYATNTGDSAAARLVKRALREARVMLPLYDTGAWSLYYRTPRRPGRESDLGYHQLFESFLSEMCDRFGSPYCLLADNFQRYQTEPVVVSGLTVREDRRHKLLRVRFTVSKRGGITVSLARGRRIVHRYSAGLFRGRHTIVWSLPRKRGSYQLSVSAQSLNGIPSGLSETVRL